MYKYIDDACINMNVYREKRVEEYLCREREREVDKQTELFLLSLNQFSTLQCSFKIRNKYTTSHILASFWALIWV